MEDAIEFLMAHWSDGHSEKRRAAKQACLDALDGKGTSTAARAAFIEAAKEAGLYTGQRKL